jgi:hypothetical protein
MEQEKIAIIDFRLINKLAVEISVYANQNIFNRNKTLLFLETFLDFKSKESIIVKNIRTGESCELKSDSHAVYRFLMDVKTMYINTKHHYQLYANMLHIFKMCWPKEYYTLLETIRM